MSAVMSSCGQYRYRLERETRHPDRSTEKVVVFIGVNFFLMGLPGYPGGLALPRMETALDYVRKHGNENTRMATWRSQAGRRDYSVEETRVLATAAGEKS